MAAKFDLIGALLDNGFERGIDLTITDDANHTTYVIESYRKDYERVWYVAFHGESTYTFWAEVQVVKKDGRPVDVRAYYSNGKVKSHDYGKRAFNAIKDTVNNHGFEL